MKTDRKLLRNVLAAGIAAAGMTSFAAQAYGPLYIYDYATATPYRWDVSEPVPVWTDGGNFASGTVTIYVPTPETCNADDGWQCGYYEDLYVEFTNEQGVARVADALASWTAVPTSTFQAAVAGDFLGIGIGGGDGDITGAPEEFDTDENGEIVHEVIGTVNNGGIHVIFDEDGSVMTNVMGAPYGVLGIASPEWADEETGIITEGWVFIGGAGTYYNDDGLAQKVEEASHVSGEKLWRLPLYDEYRDKVFTDYADIKNVGGRYGGVGSSAIFLQEFTSYPWSHWDIAGMVLDETGSTAVLPRIHPPHIIRGATGFGVRALVSLARGWE